MIPTAHDNLVLLLNGGTIVNPTPVTLAGSTNPNPTAGTTALPVHDNILFMTPTGTISGMSSTLSSTLIYGGTVMAIAPTDNSASSTLAASTPTDLHNDHILSPAGANDQMPVESGNVPSSMPGTYSPIVWIAIAVIALLWMGRG